MERVVEERLVSRDHQRVLCALCLVPEMQQQRWFKVINEQK